MFGIYLAGATLMGAGMFLVRMRLMQLMLLCAFAMWQWGFTAAAFIHINTAQALFFYPDALAVLMMGALAIIMIPAFYHSEKYLLYYNDRPRERSIYYAALMLLIMSMSAVYVSAHIAVTWVFTELSTLCAAALIYHRRNERTLEGTWKYVFICAVSITIVFIGILFLSIAMQEAGSKDISYASLLEHASALHSSWLKLGFLFVFTGFTAKMGLVPMFTAGIDAKDKAPSPAGAIFSSALVNVGFVGIFRTYTVIAHSPVHAWANMVMLISAALSVFVATVYMTRVKNIKRMLAYSGVEHMGITLLGLAAGGIGYYAALLHVLLHSFVKSGFFFQVGHVYRTFQSKSIYDIGNYFRYNTAGAIVMLLAFASAAALPPSGLFVSEFLIFKSLIGAHHVLLAVFILILLTLILWGFGKSIMKMMFIPVPGFNDEHVPLIHPLESVFQFALLLLAVYLGIAPPVFFVELLNDAVKVLM